MFICNSVNVYIVAIHMHWRRTGHLIIMMMAFSHKYTFVSLLLWLCYKLLILLYILIIIALHTYTCGIQQLNTGYSIQAYLFTGASQHLFFLWIKQNLNETWIYHLILNTWFCVWIFPASNLRLTTLVNWSYSIDIQCVILFFALNILCIAYICFQCWKLSKNQIATPKEFKSMINRVSIFINNTARLMAHTPRANVLQLCCVYMWAHEWVKKNLSMIVYTYIRIYVFLYYNICSYDMRERTRKIR